MLHAVWASLARVRLYLPYNVTKSTFLSTIQVGDSMGPWEPEQTHNSRELKKHTVLASRVISMTNP